MESTAGCGTPTALTAGTQVAGSLGPNGCALYSYALNQTTWKSYSWLDAFETGSAVQLLKGYEATPWENGWSYTFSFTVPSGIADVLFVWTFNDDATPTVSLPSGLTTEEQFGTSTGIALGALAPGTYSASFNAGSGWVNNVALAAYGISSANRFTFEFAGSAQEMTQTMASGASEYLGVLMTGGIPITNASLTTINEEAVSPPSSPTPGVTDLIGLQTSNIFSFTSKAVGYGIAAVAIVPASAATDPIPTFATYGSIGSAPGPSSWVERADGPSTEVAAELSPANDSANVWGGWGTYEFAVVGDGSSYGSYCFEVTLVSGSSSAFTPGCTPMTAQIEVSSGSSSLAAAFTASVVGGTPPYTYSWNFGDSSTSTVQNPTHTYSAGGTYTVQLQVSDSASHAASSTIAVAVGSSTGSTTRLALPRLASCVLGSVPTFLLAEAADGPSGVSSLEFLAGTYSPTTAKAIYNGTSTAHLPISWTTPTVVATFAQPITGDALVVTPNGQTVIVAVASGGLTWIFQTPNGGMSWMGLTPTALAGSSPALALGTPGLIVSTETSTAVSATVLSTQGYGAPTVTFAGAAVQAVPVWATGIASGSIGLVVTTSAGSVLYYQSIDNGFNYTSHKIGSFSAGGGSAIFTTIGSTRLSDPEGAPGAVAATADGSNVFVLYTSALAGRVAANVTTSANGGTTWNPTMTYELPTGSVGQPQVVASAVGYVYATWTDDSERIPGIDAAVFLADGRMIENATMLPGSGGVGFGPASSPTIAVDAFQRPVYVWVANATSSTPSVAETGAFLSPANALALVSSSFNQLTGWDFQSTSGGGSGRGSHPAGSGGTSEQPAADSAYSAAATALGAAVADPSTNPCYPSLAQNYTAELYHVDTLFPLVADPSASSACANLTPAEQPASYVVNTSGPFAANTYLATLTDWIFEGLGVQVDYRGDALVSAVNVGINPNSATSLLPPLTDLPLTEHTGLFAICGGNKKNPCNEFTYGWANATPQVLNPTTAAIGGVSVHFAAVYPLTGAWKNVSCQGSNGGTLDYFNATEPVSYTWTVSVEGKTRSFLQTVSPGGSWPFAQQVYLTNLTPDSGIAWSMGFNASYDSISNLHNTCTGTNSVTNLGYALNASIPGYGGLLYTNLSMVPGGVENAFVHVTAGAAPTIDGHAAAEAQSVSSISASLSTANANDLAVAFFVVSTTTSSASCSSGGTAPPWRQVFSNSPSSYPSIFAFVATETSPLSSQKVTCTSGASGNLDLSLFGVSGANLSSPVDPSANTSTYNSGIAPALSVTTTSSPELLLGFLGAYSNSTVTPGSGFTDLPYYGFPQATVEYGAVGNTGTYTVATTAPGSNAWVFHILGIRPAINENLGVAWNNTMLAAANASVTGPSYTKTLSTGAYQYADAYTYLNVPVGANYTFAAHAKSEVGAWNSTQTPSVSAGEESFSNPFTASVSCSFSLLTNPITFGGPPSVSVAATGNKATVTWTANVFGTSWLQYDELGAGLNWTQSAAGNSTATSGQYEYSVELQGLAPAALFGVTVWTSYAPVPGCVSYVASSSTVFVSSGGFPIGETDLPYDSITGQGGGAMLRWEVAPGFASKGTFLNGTVTYQNDTSTPSTVNLPLINAAGLAQTRASFAYNLSLPQPNTTYTVSVELNFSINWQSANGAVVQNVTVVSSAVTFTYLKDTSGDGLTDSEKVLGWTVPVTNLSGRTTDGWVQANPQAFATNGLVSDYIEKEYDLNPNTVDTAGSHMLDTWNLTFNLGPGSGALPAGSQLQVWYENTTYNPFATSVQYSPGMFESGAPALANTSLISAGHAATSGDGAPAAATYLWSYSALSTFETLPGVRNASWLRAVEGTWKGLPTLTIWGKLSWGADPLMQSTSGDGLADGAQANPLGPVVVQINITSWSATLASGSDEAAPYVEVSSGSSGSGTVYYGAYGPAVGDTGNPKVSYTGPYLVSVPVASQGQFAYFNISLNDAEKSGVASLATVASTKVDLVGPPGTKSLTVTGTASLSGSYAAVRIPEVANTLLWAPPNNTTLSPVPWGLKQYVAEPDFDLIVVNASARTTVTGVGGAEGGWSYSVTLQQGLNNILVPRGAFLASPLGQALINNTNVTIKSIPSGAGVTFHATDWSGRTEPSKSNAVGNSNYIWVFSTTSQAQNGSTSGAFGGLPQNGAVETGNESRQIQAVYWLNLTSGGNGVFSNGAAELDDLVGGLVLNSSGNFTGNLLNVTSEVPTLGFPSNVRVALANATVPSGGAYAAPKYQQPPSSPPWWEKLGSIVWNTITGIATKAVSAVWNLAQAASAYIGEAFTALSKGLGLLAKELVSGLKTVASAMLWALQALMTWIWHVITLAFNAAMSPLSSALHAAKVAWVSAQLGAANATLSYLNDVAGAQAYAESKLAAALELPFTFALVITTIVAILLYIAMPFEIGAGTLIDFLLPLAIAAFGASVSVVAGTGLLGPALQFASKGVGTNGFGWIDSLTEWIWNVTHSASETTAAVTSFIAPSVPGDHFALIAALLGTVGFVAGVWSASIAESQLGLSAAAQVYLTYAAAGLALFALLLTVGEYLLSVWAPAGTPATVAEAVLDIFALFFGSYAIWCAIRAELVKGEEAAIPPAAAILGMIGLFAGVGADVAGGLDLYELSSGG